jgi:hypothetical protein
MTKLHGLLITKDDDLVVEDWFKEFHNTFDSIVVVDGSTSSLTKNVCSLYSNTVYMRDPKCHITDQTLRHHGWQELVKIAVEGDWIYICHVDEFYIHDPRLFLHSQGNVALWMPLVVLPHPSEAPSWITAQKKNPRSLFKHYWWRRGTLPHLEHRMWRYVKEPFWNIELRQPSCGTIPHNYLTERVLSEVPLYFHYKCYDLSMSAYRTDGSSAKSSLNTGLPREVHGFEDLFFYEAKPFGDGYFNFDTDPSQILPRFGNPPRIGVAEDGKAVVVNDRGELVHLA